mgnify:CR=1 FL=1
MIITATEFKNNFGKYLNLLREEDLFITKNGKIVAKVINPNVSATKQLTGILEGKIDAAFSKKDIRNERVKRYEISD